MFPNARNSLRRWIEHGNKVPIPIAVTVHNVLTESSSSDSSNKSKWFRTQHETSLLPPLQLEVVVVVDDVTRIVYKSPVEIQSVQPSWEHLEERIDLPGEWWLEEALYQSMRLRFTITRIKPQDDDSGTTTNNDNSIVFLEIPIYPAKLERLNVIPECLPPNACLVQYSDGSTRVPHNLFQVLLDSQLTKPPPIEDFSRFGDDAFSVLDGVAQTPSRERSESVSALLGPKAGELATQLFPEVVQEPPPAVSFDDSEQETIRQDVQKERERLQALIAQEEAETEQELACLEEVRKTNGFRRY
jgi:hypothetical protein